MPNWTTIGTDFRLPAPSPSTPALSTHTHTVARGDTGDALIARYRGGEPAPVYAQRLREANPQVLNWDHLYPDTVLQIPQPATEAQALASEPQSAPPPTPAARTDQALARYQQLEADLAAAKRSPAGRADVPALQAELGRARGELTQALDAEIQSRYRDEFAARPTGAVLDADGIRGHGAAIAARHGDDPAAQAAIAAATDGLALDHEVAQTLLVAGSGSDPRAVAGLLAQQWPRLSPEAQARLANSPEFARLLQGLVRYVEAPLQGVDMQGREGIAAANDAAARLADLATALPPELALALAEKNLPAIERISAVRPQYTGPAYDSLARVAGHLGDGDAAQRTVANMARAYLAQSDGWRGQWVPLSVNITQSLERGTGPALALALAGELQASGRSEQSGEMLRALVRGAEAVRAQVGADLDDYREMNAELGRLLQNTQGLPPEAVERAVADYVAGKDPAWQQKFRTLESRLADNGAQLQAILGGLNALPPEVKANNPELAQSLSALANHDDTLQALAFAASRDRDFFVGERATSMDGLFDANKVSKEGAEYLKRLASSMIQQQATAIFAGVDASDPASVADAKSKLEALGTRHAGLLGTDAAQFRDATRALEGLLDVPGNNPVLMQTRLRQADSTLRGIEGFRADQPAGIAFRAIAVGAAGINFAKSTMDVIDDPTWENTVAAFGDAAGLHKDVRDLLHRPGAVSIGPDTAFADVQANARGNVRFENVNRMLGLISATGDIAKMSNALMDGKHGEAALYGLGAMGTIVMTLSTGPVGAFAGATMTAISVFGQAFLKSHNEQQQIIRASNAFLGDAGFDVEAARILADTGVDVGYLSVPTVPLMMEAGARRGLTPEQTVAWINDMPPDELQVMVNRERMANRN